MPPVPSRWSKRDDTWEPVTGRVFDVNGPVDLRTATLRFLGKATTGNVTTLIDSDDPLHGECINVEDADGSIPTEELEWPVGSGDFITVPVNRGRWTYEQSEAAVSVAGLYELEIEATKTGNKLTFPNKQADNPGWQIDPDIA